MDASTVVASVWSLYTAQGIARQIGGVMDFSLTEEQDLIRDAVAKVCADYPDEYWAQKDAD
ncbi:MAG TPA: hypothetical protein DE147_10760, partial [Gammaproteobacteria bacterium]|nr:hypothetical protein [Gammaproteobacteria bacterium]